MASEPTPPSSFDIPVQASSDPPATVEVVPQQASDEKDGLETSNTPEDKKESRDDWVSDDSDDASDSDTESNPDESQPAYDKLLKWWQKTNSSAKDLRNISKSLHKIKRTRTLDWRREMKEVITNVNGVLQLRDELNEELEKEADCVTDSDDEEDVRTCIPELHYVSWRHMMAWRHSSNTYAAIDIPSDKAPDYSFPPPPRFLPHPVSMGRRTAPPLGPPTAEPLPYNYFPINNTAPTPPGAVYSGTGTDPKHLLEQDPRASALEDFPSRIRINSIRLQMLILEEKRAVGNHINDPDLADNNSRLIIQRPFKALYYLEDKVRDRLHTYEDIRRSRNPDTSEEEFHAMYDKHPVSDVLKFGVIPSADSMDLNVLTAMINDLRCLVKFMDLYLVPERNRIVNMGISSGSGIQPHDLWHLFPVGSLIYSRDEHIPQKIWRVAHTFSARKGQNSNFVPGRGVRLGLGKTPGTSVFFLDCYYLEYDGIRYVPIHRRFQIQHGLEASITYSFKSMSLVPLRIALQDKTIKGTYKEEVLARGGRFIGYATGSRHLYYTGRSYSVTPAGEKLPNVRLPEESTRTRTIQYSVRVDSPVMVDYSRAFQEVPWWRPEGSSLNRTAVGKDIVLSGLAPNPDVDHASQLFVENDYSWDLKFFDDHMERESKKWSAWEDGSAPSAEEDLLLLPGRIFAFVFRSRKWACLQLGRSEDGSENLTEIASRAEPWTDLELPEGHKEVVQSLITWHFKADKKVNPHFDLVREKGKGVIILLHGVPGVGKTSTAECAAESNGRPLFPITCGDLGLTAQDVELKLEEIFRLAQAWGCILLLDEADVFLAQRTASDIHRNSLVSVFLRTLEHYEGILFLTTNRVGVFDEAFKSRIHISLYYPSLDHNQTYQIWQSHITKAIEAGIRVNRDELITFAAKIFASQRDPKSGPVWNGRQIRNAFQSALALAGFHSDDGQSVRLETQHFQKVFNVSDKFSNYIWRVRQGHSDADWNRMNMVRRDDYEYIPPTGLDVMNNIVPPGPYGMYPGGQARFSAGGSGAFPQSAFGQSASAPSAVFGIPQPQASMPSMSQMPGTFGAVANPFQQFAQAPYQQPGAAPLQPQQAANFQGQQQQQQATQPQQTTTQQTQYHNPFQAAQFGQTVAQNTMAQQQPQQHPQQNPFLQQDGSYAVFGSQPQPQQNLNIHPTAAVLQPGVGNLQPNQQIPNPIQQTTTFGAQQQGVAASGFGASDAAVSQQQQQQQQQQTQ
ncbi:aaa family atpase [Rhypophila decipiens]|uniref:Aaa family atpase n=1 Tax=Rhypophila decipiens TaxID=261697 RepID=A0AAN6YE12_9PEZI|nr:aaa family atpase [Rhypophila decipiens]